MAGKVDTTKITKYVSTQSILNCQLVKISTEISSKYWSDFYLFSVSFDGKFIQGFIKEKLNIIILEYVYLTKDRKAAYWLQAALTHYRQSTKWHIIIEFMESNLLFCRWLWNLIYGIHFKILRMCLVSYMQPWHNRRFNMKWNYFTAFNLNSYHVSVITGSARNLMEFFKSWTVLVHLWYFLNIKRLSIIMHIWR